MSIYIMGNMFSCINSDYISDYNETTIYFKEGHSFIVDFVIQWNTGVILSCDQSTHSVSKDRMF